MIDKIFTGTDVTPPSINVTIPAVPQMAVNLGEIALGTYEQRLNIDSAIKANTGGAFGISSVSSIKVKQFTLTLTDSDANNNFSNFESARVMLTSNSQSTPVEIMNLNFPTTNISTITQSPTTTPELLPYVKGGQLTYNIYGKARKATSKSLNMIVTVVLRVK